MITLHKTTYSDALDLCTLRSKFGAENQPQKHEGKGVSDYRVLVSISKMLAVKNPVHRSNRGQTPKWEDSQPCIQMPSLPSILKNHQRNRDQNQDTIRASKILSDPGQQPLPAPIKPNSTPNPSPTTTTSSARKSLLLYPPPTKTSQAT
jgi:hypothetical protein